MRTLLFLLLLATPSAFAQAPCADGAVSHAGLVYACSGVDLLGHVSPQAFGVSDTPVCSGCAYDVWGWTDPDTGREVVVAGMAHGATFVDVTEPAAPRVLGHLEVGARDQKTRGDFVYVADHGSRGLFAFDLRRLRGLAADPTRVFQPDGESAPADAHNVVVADGVPLAATVGGGGYRFFDLSDPAAPAEIGVYDDGSIVHDAQCLVYDGPDTDYAGRTVCLGSNAVSVRLIDVTDPLAVVPIAEAHYPEPGYTHQGWLTEDRRHFLVNDEFDEIYGDAPTRTLVFDVSNLDDPEFVGAWHNPTTAASDHNHYVHRGHLYQANYTSGLRVLSLAGVATADLEEVAFFDTYPAPVAEYDELRGAWSVYPFFPSGTVAVMDQQHGLFLLRVDPERIVSAAAAPPGHLRPARPRVGRRLRRHGQRADSRRRRWPASGRGDRARGDGRQRRHPAVGARAVVST